MTRARADELPTPPLLSRRARRTVSVIAIVLLCLLILGSLASASPWPSALAIRSVFAKGAAETVAEMKPYVPKSGVDARTGLRYAPGSPDTTFDLFRPSGDSRPLPTVVWIHGGAWISGASADVDPYLRILAGHGYTTVGLNYTVGPEATYPTAVRQLNEALSYLDAHADSLGIDRTRIVLAGDSAGSQLASQLAVMTTSPEYAHLLGMTPALKPDQLSAVVLNCGVYDLGALASLTGIDGWGFKTALWSYSGTKDWSQTYVGSTMSTVQHITPQFPPTYISGGNGDGLTWTQSVPMAAALRSAGVDVTELFWPADHQPELPHEYQFHLKFAEAHQALDATLAFLKQHA
ncbi:alpha/beta hydrolase [Leifsonia sp. SIMBA_070]|uniref:alpha/beta hydrolase n=1 Tax=Leifsonia sp. SIMBA_070 TaxID=3085810 RepID=UPI00397D27E6